MKGLPLKELASALKSPSSNEKIIQGFSIDSREIKEGEVFFALPGDKVHGENYLKEVAEKKALAAIVSLNYRGSNFGLELFYVEDVRICLHQLATMCFSKRKEKVVAVTGSVGKTTTKEFIATLLSKKYRVEKSIGTCNSQLTLPLRILNLDQEHDFLVLEMGMTLPREIEKLVQICPPDIALITKISLGHVEFFPDGLAGVAAAKAEIFSHPKTKCAILNFQATHEKSIQELTIDKLTYSVDKTNKVDFSIEFSSQGYQIREKQMLSPFFSLPFSATHLVENFLAAAAVCRHVKMSWEEILSGIKELKIFPMRFEVIQRDEITFIKDCYNANPESMRAALVNFIMPDQGGRRVAALGSMKELGRFSEESHRNIAKLALRFIDYLFCIGVECQDMVDVFSRSGKSAILCSDLMQLKTKLFNFIRPKDVVLIKGSKSHQLWKILDE